MQETNNTETLSHHGILGMKWGVRRYQNKDGSLTPAGKKKAAKMKEKYTALTGKRLIRKPTSKNSKTTDQNENNKPKRLKDMTDDELKNRINRLQMEKQAMGLQTEVNDGNRKVMSTVGKQVIVPAAVDAGKRLLTDWLMKKGKQKLGLDTEGAKDALAALRKEVDEEELKTRITRAKNNRGKWEKEMKDRENEGKTDDNTPEAESEPAGNVNDRPSSNKTYTTNNTYRRGDDTVIDDDSLWKEVDRETSFTATKTLSYAKTGQDYLEDSGIRNKRLLLPG